MPWLAMSRPGTSGVPRAVPRAPFGGSELLRFGAVGSPVGAEAGGGSLLIRHHPPTQPSFTRRPDPLPQSAGGGGGRGVFDVSDVLSCDFIGVASMSPPKTATRGHLLPLLLLPFWGGGGGRWFKASHVVLRAPPPSRRQAPMAMSLQRPLFGRCCPRASEGDRAAYPTSGPPPPAGGGGPPPPPTLPPGQCHGP